MLSGPDDRGDNVFSHLFARDGASWGEIERGVRQILADDAHPRVGDLRRVLAEFGYSQPQPTVHGMNLADAMRAAEQRVLEARADILPPPIERERNATR